MDRKQWEEKITEVVYTAVETIERMAKILKKHQEKIEQLENQILELTKNYDGR